MKICLLGDTHTQHWNVKIPETDILIFAGDAEFRSVFDVLDFNIWLGTLPQKFIYCIAGNHDFYAQKRHDEICKFLTLCPTNIFNQPYSFFNKPILISKNYKGNLFKCFSNKL